MGVRRPGALLPKLGLVGTPPEEREARGRRTEHSGGAKPPGIELSQKTGEVGPSPEPSPPMPRHGLHLRGREHEVQAAPSARAPMARRRVACSGARGLRRATPPLHKREGAPRSRRLRPPPASRHCWASRPGRALQRTSAPTSGKRSPPSCWPTAVRHPMGSSGGAHVHWRQPVGWRPVERRRRRQPVGRRHPMQRRQPVGERQPKGVAATRKVAAACGVATRRQPMGVRQPMGWQRQLLGGGRSWVAADHGGNRWGGGNPWDSGSTEGGHQAAATYGVAAPSWRSISESVDDNHGLPSAFRRDGVRAGATKFMKRLPELGRPHMPWSMVDTCGTCTKQEE